MRPLLRSCQRAGVRRPTHSRVAYLELIRHDRTRAPYHSRDHIQTEMTILVDLNRIPATNRVSPFGSPSPADPHLRDAVRDESSGKLNRLLRTRRDD